MNDTLADDHVGVKAGFAGCNNRMGDLDPVIKMSAHQDGQCSAGSMNIAHALHFKMHGFDEVRIISLRRTKQGILDKVIHRQNVKDCVDYGDDGQSIQPNKPPCVFQGRIMGCDITVESAIGVGSIFTVTIPSISKLRKAEEVEAQDASARLAIAA